MPNLCDFPALPALPHTRARGRAPKRSPHQVSSNLPPSTAPTPTTKVLFLSPAPSLEAVRKSTRIGKTPHFLLNQYQLDEPKFIKTAKANAAVGPMLRFESVKLESNSCFTFFFSSGLYTAVVHPTLFSPPQSWSVGGHQVFFHPTAIEGDLNLPTPMCRSSVPFPHPLPLTTKLLCLFIQPPKNSACKANQFHLGLSNSC